MNGYAIAYLLLNAFGFGILLIKNGQPTTHKFKTPFIMWIVITLPLLYMAGTFN